MLVTTTEVRVFLGLAKLPHIDLMLVISSGRDKWIIRSKLFTYSGSTPQRAELMNA